MEKGMCHVLEMEPMGSWLESPRGRDSQVGVTSCPCPTLAQPAQPQPSPQLPVALQADCRAGRELGGASSSIIHGQIWLMELGLSELVPNGACSGACPASTPGPAQFPSLPSPCHKNATFCC